MALGNTPVAAVPPIFSICCWDCINIPTIAGPTALPVIPVETPIDCGGLGLQEIEAYDKRKKSY